MNEKDKKMSRRDFMRMATLAAGAATVAGCAPQIVTQIVKETQIVTVKETSVVTVKETAAPAAPITVTKVVEKQVDNVIVDIIVSGNVLSEADAIKEAMLFTVYLQNYNLKNKGVVAHYNPWPVTNEYQTKIRLMTASGELKDTIVWGNWGGIGSYVNDKTLLALDDSMKAANVKAEEYIPSALQLVQYDEATKTPFKGKTYALPTMSNPGAAFVFYNVDMLKAAGITTMPTEKTTLKELADMAMAVKDKTGKFGLNENLWGTTHGFSYDQGYVGPFGGWILDEEGKKSLVNSAECQEAYMYAYEARHVKKFEPTPDDYKAMGDYKQGIEAGKLAMYKMGAWGGAWITVRGKNEKPEMGFSVFPASYDGRKNSHAGNTMGIDWYGVSANAKNTAACFDVLYFLTAKDAGLFQLNNGAGVWCRPDILNAPEMAKALPILQATAKAVATAERTRTPGNQRDKEVGDVFTQAMATVDTGRTKPDKAFLDKLAADMQKVLDMPKV